MVLTTEHTDDTEKKKSIIHRFRRLKGLRKRRILATKRRKGHKEEKSKTLEHSTFIRPTGEQL
jgi:hypothetical protein